MYFLLLVM